MLQLTGVLPFVTRLTVLVIYKHRFFTLPFFVVLVVLSKSCSCLITTVLILSKCPPKQPFSWLSLVLFISGTVIPWTNSFQLTSWSNLCLPVCFTLHVLGNSRLQSFLVLQKLQELNQLHLHFLFSLFLFLLLCHGFRDIFQGTLGKNKNTDREANNFWFAYIVGLSWQLFCNNEPFFVLNRLSQTNQYF